jgi:hypothetical protein|tara:strand:+ start:932 stop:1441 length:510 start_codon:yes stop_codon:yes gene_type:complete
MATVYFVTENYIKQTTALTKNVDANEIMPFIATAAQTWTQSILGTYFFDYLLASFNAQTLTANEEILVSKIQPSIAWRAASDCVLELTYQLKNKGLQKQNGDNSESVELSEMGFVKTHYENKAEFFESFIVEYLKINKGLFPEFTSKLNKSSVIKHQEDDNFNSDILFI